MLHVRDPAIRWVTCHHEGVTAKDPRPEDRPVTRANSLGALERVFDVLMMVLFALLGVLLGGVGVMLRSGQSVLGGVLVLLGAVPLWAGGRPRPDGSRRLRWYPVALALLAAGLVVFVHPWTGSP